MAALASFCNCFADFLYLPLGPAGAAGPGGGGGGNKTGAATGAGFVTLGLMGFLAGVFRLFALKVGSTAVGSTIVSSVYAVLVVARPLLVVTTVLGKLGMASNSKKGKLKLILFSFVIYLLRKTGILKGFNLPTKD